MNHVLERERRPLLEPPTIGQHRPAPGRLAPSVMLLPVRIFLAAGWLRAGAEKLIDRNWWSGAKLDSFLTQQHDQAIAFFRPVMDHAIDPAHTFIAFVVMATQLLCGVAIALGVKLRLALRWAFLLNVTFILAGRVNPSAFYLVMETVMLFAIADGTLGRNHTAPSGRSFIAAGAAAAISLVFVPYIRTIEPAKVIEDPAMMLAFLGAVTSVTFVVRRAAHPAFRHSRLGELWTRHLAAWSSATPRTSNPSAERALDYLNTCPIPRDVSGLEASGPSLRRSDRTTTSTRTA